MKRRESWRVVRAALAERRPAGTPQAAADFWRDFHGRLPRQSPVAVPACRAPRPHVWQWSTAGVCAALTLMAGYLGLTHATTAGNMVQSYQVHVPHTAVMLMTDRVSEATILWVAGMECE